MKIVLDANVVIAAFAARGLCESVLELCLHGHQIVLSEGLLDEILRNLRQKIKLPASVIDEIGEFLREHAKMFEPTSLPSDLCRDTDDVKILGLAVSAQADLVITGGKDLLVMNDFRKNASGFINEVEHGETRILIRRGKPVAEIAPFSGRSEKKPAWKQPGVRLQIKGSDLSSAILEERDAGI